MKFKILETVTKNTGGDEANDVFLQALHDMSVEPRLTWDANSRQRRTKLSCRVSLRVRKRIGGDSTEPPPIPPSKVYVVGNELQSLQLRFCQGPNKNINHEREEQICY